MQKGYKSELSDEDCRIIVDHLLTNKHRELLMIDLANFHKSIMKKDFVFPWTHDNGKWVAGHYQFKVKINKHWNGRKYTSVEKIWVQGKYHKPKKGWI